MKEKPMLYQKTPLGREIEITHMVSFHYFEYVKNFFGKEESHDFWEFVYVDSGEILAVAGGEQVLLHSGEGYLHRPWESHNVMTKGIFSSVVIFSFSSSSKALEGLAGKKLTLFREEQKELVKLLQYGQAFLAPPYDDFRQEKLVWKQADPSLGAQLLKNQMEILFLTLARRFQQEAEGGEPRNGEPLQGTLQESKEEKNLMLILRILSGHLNDNCSLEEMAKEAAFSVSYMEKLFRRKLNDTVKDYYHRLKIEEAKKLISEGDLTFTEIAEQLGYGSIHNFSRVFKKYTKLSPTGYQKTARNRGLR